MSNRNLFCDHPNCVKPAVIFLLRSTKTKVCLSHLPIYTEQQAFPIEAFSFIHSAGDHANYSQRQEYFQTGLDNLTSWETACKLDLSKAQTTLQNAQAEVIQAVQNTFEEMEKQLKLCYEKEMGSISYLRKEVEIATWQKDAQMKAEDEAMVFTPLRRSVFHLVIGSCTAAITEMLLSQCHFLSSKDTPQHSAFDYLHVFAKEQCDMGHPEVAAEVAAYMKDLGEKCDIDYSTEAQKYRDEESVQLLTLLPLFSPKEDYPRGLRNCVQAASDSRMKGRYAEAASHLNRSKTFLSHLQEPSPEWALEQGLLLAHEGKWSEAERTLHEATTQCKDKDLLGKLYLSLVELYCQMAQLRTATEGAKWILINMTDVAPYIRAKALYHYCRQAVGKETPEQLLLGMWLAPLQADNSQTQGVLNCIQAEQALSRDDTHKAAELLEQSLNLIQSDYYLSVCVRYTLADLYETMKVPDQVEINYVMANSLIQDHFPHSIDSALVLSGLGELRTHLKQDTEAVPLLEQACTIFTGHSPVVGYPTTLLMLGQIYSKRRSTEDKAERCMSKAIDLFDKHFPEHIQFAHTLYYLGAMFATQGRWTAAEEKLGLARALYIEKHRQSDVEDCDKILARIPK